jgi:hypothetical protein
MDAGHWLGIMFATFAVLIVIAKMRYRLQPTRRQLAILLVAVALGIAAVLARGGMSFLLSIAAFYAACFSGEQVPLEPSDKYIPWTPNERWSGRPSEGELLERKYNELKLSALRDPDSVVDQEDSAEPEV